MSIWTIKIGEDPVADPADLGLEGLKGSIVTQAADTLSLNQKVAYDAAPVIPYGAKVVLFRDGARWFQGTCTGISRQGSGTSESIAYTVSGPWWQLEQITYEQAATRYIDGAQATVYSPSTVIGSNAAGDRIDSSAAITDALQFALSELESAAQFEIGTIEAPAEIPWDAVNAITCAEIIRRVLRWAPDRVAYFDYSAEVPLFNIVPRSSLDALSFTVGSDLTIVNNKIDPRNDLQRDGVVITYERVDTIDGQERRVIIRDSAGTTSDPLKTLRLYIDLAGAQINNLEQDIKTATIQKDSPTWWQKRHPALKDATAISVANATQTATDDGDAVDGGNDGTEYSRQIMDGQVAPWMDAGVNEQVVTADITYTPAGGSPVTERKRLVFEATNAATGTYTTLGPSTAAEPTPVGLASQVLSSIADLQYDGTIILKDGEIAATPHIARRININGGRTEWQSMAAQVYRVDYDIDAGQTTIQFGVAKHLSPSDILALYRATRDRRPALASARASSASSRPRLPTRGRNTSTADDAGASPEVPPLNAYWTDKAAGKLKVKPGTVDGVEVTGTDTEVTGVANGWLKVTLSEENGPVSTAAVVAADPGPDTATVASRKIYAVTGTAPDYVLNNFISGSQDHDSCGTDHSFILS